MEQSDLNIIPLKTMLKDAKGEADLAKLKHALSVFRCENDPDVEPFLHKKAVDFENANKCRTYLCFDGALNLVGYYTLAIRTINNVVEEDGSPLFEFGYVPHYVPTYLLALMGKDKKKFDEYKKREKVSASFLELVMPKVLENIKLAQSFVGGQAVYLDCVRTLRPHYEKYGFEYLQDCAYDSEMIQMMQRI